MDLPHFPSFEELLNSMGSATDEFVIDHFDQLVDWMYLPDQVKSTLKELAPFVMGRQAFPPVGTQWTSWQYFTGQVDASQGVIAKLLDLVGVKVEEDTGTFYVVSSRHPEQIYKLDMILEKSGYAFGLKVSKILRFLTKMLQELKAAPWVLKAVEGLRTMVVLYAKYSKRLERLTKKLPKDAQKKIEEGSKQVVDKVNGILDGVTGQGPLQNIRRSPFNAQEAKVEKGAPTGLLGPIFIVDVGLTVVGEIKLIFMFMGGPVWGALEQMPFAYKYFGTSLGYGAHLSAEAGFNIAFGYVTSVTEIDAKTGQSKLVATWSP
jgi:hypothetical protein